MKLQVLRGPNIWAKRPVLQATVAIQLPQLMQATDWLESIGLSSLELIGRPQCTPRLLEEFHAQSDHAGQLAILVRFLAVEFQKAVGQPIEFGQVQPTAEAEVFTIIVQYDEETVARASLNLALSLCADRLSRLPFDLPAELAKLCVLSEDVSVGLRTILVVNAARARNIPVRRLDAVSLIQLGEGLHQQRVRTTITGRTSLIAESISIDKQLSKELLCEVGVPVPTGRLVEDAADAWRASQEIGLPVVVKPRNADYGNGVTLNLKTQAQVEAAFKRAREFREDVLVESFCRGAHHRILVINDRVVAALRRTPAQVVGDGWKTIRQLVDEVNQDPSRGNAPGPNLDRLPIQNDTLAEQGYHQESIPSTGVAVLLEWEAKGWSYGVNQDVTDTIHPTVIEHAKNAVRAIGLDVAGLDVIADSLERPLEEQNGVVLEINADPSVVLHRWPWSDRDRPVGEVIVESLIPRGESGRVPIVAMTGTGELTLAAKLTAQLLRLSGRNVGMHCSQGTYFNDQQIAPDGTSDYDGSRRVLFHPRTDTAVFQVQPAGILHDGLGFDHCMTVVVNNQREHASVWDSEAADNLTNTCRAVLQLLDTSGSVIIHSADPALRKLRDCFKGNVIYIANEFDEDIALVCPNGRSQMVYTRGSTIVLQSPRRFDAVALSRLGPLTIDQLGALKVAVAVAWSMNVSLHSIRRGIDSFRL